jgi:RND family efflux transporter MFP subunit
MMRRLAIIGVLLICLALLGLPACGTSDDGDEIPPNENGSSTVPVTVNGDGTITATNDRLLAFSTVGEIERIYVAEGDTVGRGDTLAKLDTTTLELALARAETDLFQLQAALAQAQASRDLSEYNLYQLKKVYYASSDRISVARAQLEADKMAIEAAGRQVTLAEQAVNEARKQLDKATLTAPFDGEVAQMFTDEGDSIVTGTAILRLVDPASMQLIARINELDIVNVRTGQTAMISVDAMPETVLGGTVVFISPVDRNPGTVLFEDEDEEKEYEVKIDFDIPENLPIRVGMNAAVEITVNK